MCHTWPFSILKAVKHCTCTVLAQRAWSPSPCSHVYTQSLARTLLMLLPRCTASSVGTCICKLSLMPPCLCAECIQLASRDSAICNCGWGLWNTLMYHWQLSFLLPVSQCGWWRLLHQHRWSWTCGDIRHRGIQVSLP